MTLGIMCLDEDKTMYQAILSIAFDIKPLFNIKLIGIVQPLDTLPLLESHNSLNVQVLVSHYPYYLYNCLEIQPWKMVKMEKHNLETHYYPHDNESLQTLAYTSKLLYYVAKSH